VSSCLGISLRDSLACRTKLVDVYCVYKNVPMIAAMTRMIPTLNHQDPCRFWMALD